MARRYSPLTTRAEQRSRINASIRSYDRGLAMDEYPLETDLSIMRPTAGLVRVNELSIIVDIEVEEDGSMYWDG